jgi:hypothetical protein
VSYFHLTFRPNLKHVSTVREFVVQFYRRSLVDNEMSSRLAIATHELLENAVNYAADDETSLRVEIAQDQLIIKTWNRSDEGRLARLCALIDEMNANDPDHFYQTVMERTAFAEGSGLGLARIRAEAEMQVAYQIEHGSVCVRATAAITGLA